MDRIISVYGESLNTQVKQYIKDYITIIKRELMGSDQLTELSRKIYTNHRELFDFINDHKPDILDSLKDILHQEAKKRSWIMGSETRTYFRFLTKPLKDLIYYNKETTNGWKQREGFLLEIVLYPPTNKLNFKTIKQESLLNYYKKICNDIVKEQNATLFLDKTPRYYYIINDLLKYFPDAKIVILTRNPLDVFNSIINTWVKTKYSLLHNFLDDLFVAPELLSNGIKNQNVYHLKYEDLISNQNLELHNLCNYLGIRFESGMLNVSNSKDWKFGDPNMNDKKEVKSSNKNLWKQDLTPQKWRLFNEYINSSVSQFYQDLGYDIKEIKIVLNELKPNKFRLCFSIGFRFLQSFFSKKILFNYYYYKTRIIRKLNEN